MLQRPLAMAGRHRFESVYVGTPGHEGPQGELQTVGSAIQKDPRPSALSLYAVRRGLVERRRRRLATSEASVQVRDGNGSSFVTHDPWLLHHFILRMGLGGAWHGGTGQPSRS